MSLSEAELIGVLARLAGPGGLGLTDDAACLTPPAGHDLIITADAVVAGVHFFGDERPEDIGWKALAVNLSDLAAKGAQPLAYTLCLALPAAPEAAWAEALAAGLGEAQAVSGIALIGGDTVSSGGGPLSLAITAFGTVPAGGMVRRSGARAGDALYVSGRLGVAARGLTARATGDSTHPALSAYLRPQPRLSLIPTLRAYASAAMDLSDGLALDAARMAAASGVRLVLDLATLPADDERAALTGGDDYEILAAIPPAKDTVFCSAAAAAGVAVTRIGHAEAGVGVMDAHGAPISAARAFRHF